MPARDGILPTQPDRNHLADKRYATVVLRLVLDKHGRLMHGELVDVEGTLQQRFKGRRGLTQAVRTWLAGQELETPPSDP